MPDVKDIMRRIDKTVHVDHPLSEAQLRMTRYGLDLIPVVDGNEIVGVLEKSAIFSETEATTHASNGDKVKDRLTGEVVFCYETDTVRTALATMRKSGHEGLVVVNEDRQLSGLLTDAMVRDHLPESAAPPVANDQAAEDRQAETAGRAKGDRPGKPGNYSAGPRVSKDNGD